MASKALILLCLIAVLGQIWAIPVPDDGDGRLDVYLKLNLLLLVFFGVCVQYFYTRTFSLYRSCFFLFFFLKLFNIRFDDAEGVFWMKETKQFLNSFVIKCLGNLANFNWLGSLIKQVGY